MVACPEIIPRSVNFRESSTMHEVPLPCLAILISEDFSQRAHDAYWTREEGDTMHGRIYKGTHANQSGYLAVST